MYSMQIGSMLRLFASLKEMIDNYKRLPAVQRMCCTLFDYSKKLYAEGHDLKNLVWHAMPY